MTGPVFEFDPEQLLAEEPFVRRLAQGLLFDGHRVDDVVQATWLAALRKPPQHAAGRRGALRRWLASVVRGLAANEVRRRVRQEQREAATSPPAPTPTADELLAREERRHQIVATLQALAEPYRSAVARRYLEGLEPAEIARRTGVPTATVRTQVRRGLEQMRERLDHVHGGDRSAWCTVLLPLVGSREASVAGMAGTLFGVIAMPKFLAAAVAVIALLFFVPRFFADPPAPSRTASASESRGDRLATGGPTAAPVASAPQARTAASTPTPRSGPRAGAGALRGRMLRPDGTPAAGIRLDAFAFDGLSLFDAGFSLPAVAATTGDDGAFLLPGLPLRATCAMVADADGDLRQMMPLPASPAPDAVVDVGDLQLQARGEMVGAVVDEDGAPIAGAEVFCADVPSMVLAVMPVDRLDPVHGVLMMLPRPMPGHLGEPDRWCREVRQHLAGPVLEADYGRHAADAWQPLVIEGAPLQPLWQRLPFARTRTGADGRFCVRGIVPGNNLLVARSRGRTTAVRPAVRADSNGVRDVGTLTLGAGELLRGQVVDTDGNPVPHAEVRACQLGLLGFRGLAPCEPSVTSDAEGRFTVPGLSRGKVVVAFRSRDSQPWRTSGPVATDDEVGLTVPRPVTVPLHLRLPPGATLANVTLSARPAPPLGELSRGGFGGTFAPQDVQLAPGDAVPTVQLEPGCWTLRCVVPGAAPSHRLVLVPSDVPVELAPTPLVAVDVTVRDANGQPCRVAEVFAQTQTDPDAGSVMPTRFGMATFAGPWPSVHGHCDDHGHVRLQLPLGAVRLSANGGTLGAATREVDVDSPTTLDLHLGGTGRVLGQLMVGPILGGDPTAFRVTVARGWLNKGGEAIDSSASVRPDRDGRFTIDGLPPGDYRLQLRSALPPALSFATVTTQLLGRSGFRKFDEITDQPIVIVAGSETPVRFDIGGIDARLGGVRGTLRRTGKTAGPCTIWARDRQREDGVLRDGGFEDRARATVADDGTFVIDDLAPRTWWFAVRDGDDGPFVASFVVDVVAGTRTPVAIEVHLGALAGTVRRPDGRAAAGVSVLAHARITAHELPVFSQQTETDKTGRFVFDELAAGDYELQVDAPDLRHDLNIVTVHPGGETAAPELHCRARHVLVVVLADDVVVPPGSHIEFQLLREGRRRHSSVGMARTTRFLVDDAGSYAVDLRIGSQWYHGDPAPIEVPHPAGTVVLRPAAPFTPL